VGQHGARRRYGRPRSHRLLPLALTVAVLGAAGGWLLLGPGLPAPWVQEQAAAPPEGRAATTAARTSAAETSAAEMTAALTTAGPAPFDRTLHSIDDPASIWVVVDKAEPLSPPDYAPDDLVAVGGGHQLRAEAAAAMRRMFADAAAQGLPMQVDSAYRSYSYQQGVFSSAVSRLGRAQALRASARPGFSEHQTGLSADIGGGGCDIDSCFAGTRAGRWVAENGHRYGFVIRYPEGEEAVTGYKYEPWHVRYVGVELATAMEESGVATLEEFFGLPAAPTYSG
jgi:D-alanyl-D-alanine carboxypeptidase